VNRSSLSLPSFAKVNWSLRILGKRPDGYHEVRTILQTVSLEDQIRFEVSDEGIQLVCDDPSIPTDDRNLVVRAAKSLKKRYRVEKGARIRLLKRIPAKGGLGGGSSNAAVSLVALSHLWELKPSRSELIEIASELGSDVPFFLFGGIALGTGTGATISSLQTDESCTQKHLIIITPRATVSTVDAYAAISAPALTTMEPESILPVSHIGAKSEDSVPCPADDALQNDFESVIFDIEPEIRRARDTLLQAGATGALLAGSGSSVFGVFADRRAQQKAIENIQVESGWRISPCVTLSRDEYRQRMGNGVSLFSLIE